MFKKFLLSLVFVGSIGAQSDAMQVNLAELDPVDLANEMYSIEALSYAEGIVRKIPGYSNICNSNKVIEFMNEITNNFRGLNAEQQNAFIIYLSYLGHSELGELNCDDDVIITAADLLNDFKKAEFYREP